MLDPIRATRAIAFLLTPHPLLPKELMPTSAKRSHRYTLRCEVGGWLGPFALSTRDPALAARRGLPSLQQQQQEPQLSRTCGPSTTPRIPLTTLRANPSRRSL